MMKRSLLIDGNYMLNRIRSVSGWTFMENKEKDRREFLTSLSMHVSAEIRRNKDWIDNIVMCKDHRSWRKDIEIVRKDEETQDYKGQRVKSEDIDWQFMFDTFEYFCEHLHNNFDVPYTHVNGAEGDDAVMFWSKVLQKLEKKSLIYGSDNDLNQLVSMFTMVFRHVKTKVANGQLIVSDKYLKWYNSFKSESAIFKDLTQIQHDKLLLNDKVLGKNLFDVNPYKLVLYKIFKGDSKDNIPELYNWGKSSARRFHLKERHFEDALEQIGIEDFGREHLLNDDILYSILLYFIHKVGKTDVDIELAIKMIEQNRKLLFLDPIMMPEYVLKGLTENVKSQLNYRADIPRLVSYTNITDSMGINVRNDQYMEAFGKNL